MRTPTASRQTARSRRSNRAGADVSAMPPTFPRSGACSTDGPGRAQTAGAYCGRARAELPDPLALNGPWRAAVADEGLRRSFADAGLDDGAWETVDVPGHWRSAPAFAGTDGPVLHRRRYE